MMNSEEPREKLSRMESGVDRDDSDEQRGCVTIYPMVVRGVLDGRRPSGEGDFHLLSSSS